MIFDGCKYFESQEAQLMQLNQLERVVHHNYLAIIINVLIRVLMDHYMAKQSLIKDLNSMINFLEFFLQDHQICLYSEFYFCSLLFNLNHQGMESFNHKHQLDLHPFYLFFISLQILNVFLHLITNSFPPIDFQEIDFIRFYFKILYCLVHFHPNKQQQSIRFSFCIR